ncbi:DNA topoisomerase [Hydrogenimonas sp.]|nr:DNA topoisomerase [Hydrogenimonas sp.]
MGFKTSSGVERIFTVELKKVDGKWRAWVDFEAGSEPEVLGSCPLCGSDVVESPLSFGCSKWDNGCRFAIFKNSLKRFGGKMLGKHVAAELLRSGETEVKIRAFDGSERSVRLVLDPDFGCSIDFDREL